MCARVTMLTYDEVLRVVQAANRGEVLNPFPDWPAVPPRPDAFPQSDVALAVASREASNLLEARILKWGYPVGWQATPVFNTRIESIASGSGMWRESAARRRCAVPTVRFFERHASERVRSRATGRQMKRMYEFRLVGEPVTWLAGIYEDDHFSVVTTEPNQDVAPVHGRMPMVLRHADVPLWLGEDYLQLADRSGVRLRVAPEQGRPDGRFDGSPEPPEQLALF